MITHWFGFYFTYFCSILFYFWHSFLRFLSFSFFFSLFQIFSPIDIIALYRVQSLQLSCSPSHSPPLSSLFSYLCFLFPPVFLSVISFLPLLFLLSYPLILFSTPLNHLPFHHIILIFHRYFLPFFSHPPHFDTKITQDDILFTT